LYASPAIALFLILAAFARDGFARKWTDDLGRSIEAEFIEFRDGNVRLRRADGKVGSIPFERLSEEDQAFVRSKQSLQTPKTVGTLELGTRGAGAMCVDPLSRRLYVAAPGDGQVIVVDGQNLKVATKLSVGKHPSGVAVLPALQRLYVINRDSRELMVFDTKTYQRVETITTQGSAEQIVANRRTNRLWILRSPSDGVSIIDGKTLVTERTWRIDHRAQSIALDETTETAYVINYRDGVWKVSHNRQEAVQAQLELRPFPIFTDSAGSKALGKPMPYGLTLDSSSKRLFVALDLSGEFLMLDTTCH